MGTKRIFSEEHKRKIGESRKKLKANGWIPYNLGLKMDSLSVLKNMKAHLKYDVSIEWLSKFEDIEKLKYLNRSLSRKNLQFISWLENRAKIDIDQELWNKMKQNINYYL